MLRLSLCATFLFAAALLGCGRGSSDTTPATASSTPNAVTATAQSDTAGPAGPSAAEHQRPANPTVVLHSNLGDITIRLLADKAPRAVENFLRGYAERGYYDQTIFHHVEAGQMLIAGGYSASLERKPVRSPIYNESRNGVSNRRGTVAMVHEAESPHSATADFFINLADNPHFDHQGSGDDEQHGYCVFGEVIAGMDIVDRIATLDTTAKAEFPKVPTPVALIQSFERTMQR